MTAYLFGDRNFVFLERRLAGGQDVLNRVVLNRVVLNVILSAVLHLYDVLIHGTDPYSLYFGC